MKQNTKHNLAFLVVFILSMLLGGSASEYEQLEGLFAGFFLACFAYLMMIKWFPREVKNDTKMKNKLLLKLVKGGI